MKEQKKERKKELSSHHYVHLRLAADRKVGADVNVINLFFFIA
jgi:hypothetical protein